MQKSLKDNEPLTWRSISVLVASLLLFVFSGPIIRLFSLSIAMNFSLTASQLNTLLAIEVPMRLALYVCFGGLFVYTFVSHRKIEGKRLIKPLLVSITLLLIVFMFSSALTEPIVKAETTAVTGYYLARPIPGADWYLGKLSDGTYYAINGSNWNDLTAVEPWQSSPPWASYASNYTQLTQQALASLTYGEIYLKEVPFNYNLTIPANVQVVENVNGLTRTFINSANSQGSPYTISVDTVNTQYYMAQDSAKIIVNGWTSINSSQVNSYVVSALSSGSGGTIAVSSGTYTVSKSWLCNQNGITYNFAKGAELLAAKSLSSPCLLLSLCSNCLVQGITVDGNAANQAQGSNPYYANGVMIYGGTNDRVTQANIFDCLTYGVDVFGGLNSGVDHSLLYNCGSNAFTATGSSSNAFCNFNNLYGCSDIGVCSYGYATQIIGNYIHDFNGTTGTGGNAEWGLEIAAPAPSYSGGTGDFISQNDIVNTETGMNIVSNGNSVSENSISNTNGNPAIILTSCSQNSLQNNNITKTLADSGIRLVNSTLTDITGNYVSFSYIDGIYLDGNSNNNTVEQNWCFNNAMNAGFGVGIDIYGNYNYVSQNQCFDTHSGASRLQYYGIYVRSGATSNQFIQNNEYNDLYGQLYGECQDAGTGSIWNDQGMQPENLGNLGVLSSNIETVTVNQATTAGQLLYKVSTGGYALASGTSVATMADVIAIQAVGSSGSCLVMTSGSIRNDAFATMTIGTGDLYTSMTAGNFTLTAPSASGNIVQDMGKVVAAHIITFYNNGAWGTHV